MSVRFSLVLLGATLLISLTLNSELVKGAAVRKPMQPYYFTQMAPLELDIEMQRDEDDDEYVRHDSCRHGSWSCRSFCWMKDCNSGFCSSNKVCSCTGCGGDTELWDSSERK